MGGSVSEINNKIIMLGKLLELEMGEEDDDQLFRVMTRAY